MARGSSRPLLSSIVVTAAGAVPWLLAAGGLAGAGAAAGLIARAARRR